MLGDDDPMLVNEGSGVFAMFWSCKESGSGHTRQQ
jgi:hypothetical protein